MIGATPDHAGKRPIACYGACMIHRGLATIIAISLGALTSACASDSGRYPSLAIRDAERVQGSAQPVEPQEAPPPAEAPSQDLLARLEQLKDEAAAAHKAFMATAPTAERQVAAARGAATASAAWVSAQVSLATLEASRGRLMIALADLDSLHVAAQLEGGARATISAARDEVDLLAQTENEIVSRLLSRISG